MIDVQYHTRLIHKRGKRHQDLALIWPMPLKYENLSFLLNRWVNRLAMMQNHYIDVIMTTMASQITSITFVYSTVYSDADQRKHQSSASLAFVWGIHRDRWIPRTKGQLRGKCFHLMTSSCNDWRTTTVVLEKDRLTKLESRIRYGTCLRVNYDIDTMSWAHITFLTAAPQANKSHPAPEILISDWMLTSPTMNTILLTSNGMVLVSLWV